MAARAGTVVRYIKKASAGGDGWWDFPIPEYIADERQEEYHQVRATEQHL
jgi:hypothetical protein